jgi:hypothetical protein
MNIRQPWPAPAGQVLDAQLHLLDRQILDRDDVPVTTVDDIEISDIELDAPIDPNAPAPVITGFLTGPVLGTRIFGGRPPQSRWESVPWSCVARVGTVISLGVPGGSLSATWTERWVRDHIIRRIPGAGHDPE